MFASYFDYSFQKIHECLCRLSSARLASEKVGHGFSPSKNSLQDSGIFLRTRCHRKNLPATIQIDKDHKCIASWRHFSGLEVKEGFHECRELPRNWPMRNGHQPEWPWPGCGWLINLPQLPKVDLRISETSVQLMHIQWYPNRPYNSIK